MIVDKSPSIKDSKIIRKNPAKSDIVEKIGIKREKNRV